MAALLITLQSISSSTVVLAEIKETTSTLLLLLLLLRVICHVLLIKVSDRLEVESISGWEKSTLKNVVLLNLIGNLFYGQNVQCKTQLEVLLPCKQGGIRRIINGSPPTGKSFDFKSYWAIPKKYLVLTLGLATKGYFLGGENFFWLAIELYSAN